MHRIRYFKIDKKSRPNILNGDYTRRMWYSKMIYGEVIIWNM